jgi:alpha-beta hydrolase superfamily lysophospholipase
MAGTRRWTIGVATSTGLLGLTVTSGLAVLAHRFVEEFSRPHTLLDLSAFTWGLPQVFTEPPRSCQRSLLFRAADGTLLCGDFWAQPQSAPTIVLCHGYRVSRSHLRAVAALQYKFGYNVFCFDFRGHGDSDSVMTSGGNAEVRDLEAALVVASRQPETLSHRIIIHGFSMGAAVALLTRPHPEVVAIIADSPFARSDDILYRLINFHLLQLCHTRYPQLRFLRPLIPPLSWAVIAASKIDFRLRFGFTFVARPDTSFRRWKTRARKVLEQHSIPILLIHGAADSLIPIDHARQIASEARRHDVPLETYFVEGADHCSAYAVNPQRYNHVIRTFLQRCLGNDFPALHGELT